MIHVKDHKQVRKFLVNLKRHHGELYRELGDLAERYEEKNDGQFAGKPSESARTLQQVGNDCFSLVERFRARDAVGSMASYQLLVRLFGEQCVLEKTDDGAPQVLVKPNKEVPSDSLQNPSDPDATYCGHKGKGYQVQVMETYSPDKSQPDLITHVELETACESDANALLPAVEDAAKRELAPAELLADSLYGSDENLEKAKELGVELVSPAMGSAPEGISLAEFTFTDVDEMIACPQGHKPQRTKTGKKGAKIVHFYEAACDNCPVQSGCPVKRVKKSATLSYDAKSLRLARRRAKEKKKTFREAYRFRAGVEGTMSDLDRVTGIKHLRVRGRRQVRLAAVLKATRLNILRAAAFKNRLRGPKPKNGGSCHPPKGLVGVVNEQFLRLWNFLRPFVEAFPPGDYRVGGFTTQME